MEILPGIHRIQSDLGVRFMCQYLLVGEDRTVLVDTGLAGTDRLKKSATYRWSNDGRKSCL